MADSRTALLLAVLILPTARWRPQLFGALSKIAPWFLPMTAAVVPVVLAVIAGAIGGGNLSRNGNDFTTATGRADIWSIVLPFVLHGHLHNFVGYGDYGHLISAVSYRYAYIFGARPHPELQPTHNFFLQTALDTGFVGCIAGLWLFVASALASARKFVSTLVAAPAIARLSLATLAGIALVMLLGSVEASPMIYIPDGYLTFLVLVAVAATHAPTERPLHVVGAQE